VKEFLSRCNADITDIDNNLLDYLLNGWIIIIKILHDDNKEFLLLYFF
jgi:hypothetical protein